MNKKSISKDSQTDWERLDKIEDEDIDLSEIPEITEEQMNRAQLRIGGEPIQKGKVRVNIYLDSGIVVYFKAKARGRGYQTLINEALKESIHQHDLETVIRRVIREELSAAKWITDPLEFTQKSHAKRLII